MHENDQPPVLIYLVTEDWFFRLLWSPMATAAKNAGYDVHVATHVNKHGADIHCRAWFPCSSAGLAAR